MTILTAARALERTNLANMTGGKAVRKTVDEVLAHIEKAADAGAQIYEGEGFAAGVDMADVVAALNALGYNAVDKTVGSGPKSISVTW